MWGGVVDGVGTWLFEDKDDKGPFTGRGLWREIAAAACRWTQTVSRDDGKTWNGIWQMKWTRV